MVPFAALLPTAGGRLKANIGRASGIAKRELLQRACASGDVRDMPIRLALWQERVPCQLFHAD